jgi:hypothetical protein
MVFPLGKPNGTKFLYKFEFSDRITQKDGNVFTFLSGMDAAAKKAATGAVLRRKCQRSVL